MFFSVFCVSLPASDQIKENVMKWIFIIGVVLIALFDMAMYTACVLMEKAEEVRHGRFNQEV